MLNCLFRLEYPTKSGFNNRSSMSGKKKLLLGLVILFGMANYGCQKVVVPKPYLTENVIIIVFDGARYSETWGDPSHQYIPFIANEIVPQGVLSTNFKNGGATLTVPGHSAMATGVYEVLTNDGHELSSFPSVFQEWLYQTRNPSYLAWIISSKDKLDNLGNCKSLLWKVRNRPYTDCGIGGLDSGARTDSATCEMSKQILKAYRPHLALISFKEPDISGHTGIWEDYVAALKKSDEYIGQIWDFINTDQFYMGKTTVFITNDHGRHLDSIADGFVSHGDQCDGCTHIFMSASGPDFKKDYTTDQAYELIDISKTIAKLLDFSMQQSTGRVMEDLFK